MLPQRNVEMIAELVNWLRRSLTSREIAYAARYFNRTWEFGRTRSGCVKYSQELIRQAEGQLPLDIGDLVSACTTEVDLSQKVQALSKSDKFVYRRQHSKPDPQFTEFKFPKTFIGGCNRSFNHDWLDQHKWRATAHAKLNQR